MDSDKKEKILKKATVKDPYAWALHVDEEVYHGDIKSNVVLYTDEEFHTNGFPISLICYYLIGKPLQEHPWAYTLLEAELPVCDKKIYTTMNYVEARNKEGYISFYQIDQKAAREIITDYLRDEVDFDDNQIGEIISDLGLKGPTLTSKKGEL